MITFPIFNFFSFSSHLKILEATFCRAPEAHVRFKFNSGAISLSIHDIYKTTILAPVHIHLEGTKYECKTLNSCDKSIVMRFELLKIGSFLWNTILRDSSLKPGKVLTSCGLAYFLLFLNCRFYLVNQKIEHIFSGTLFYKLTRIR